MYDYTILRTRGTILIMPYFWSQTVVHRLLFIIACAAASVQSQHTEQKLVVRVRDEGMLSLAIVSYF
jgi:hypothetical protein